MNRADFKRTVWAHYKKEGRHDLPWRPPSLKLRTGKKDDVLYRVLVSEIMLQQTQVERVIPFYKNFIKQFPTAKKLAAAPLTEVLKAWQGLGYNRRAKMLHEAAKELTHTPSFFTRSNLVTRLETLPGVGPYTARAVAAFAYNEDVTFIETNIRTVVIHHFFAKKKPYSAKAMKGKKVSDTEIEKILKEVLPKGRAREWYSALMDYGAFLKRSGISHNTKSKTYTKQSKFAGSLREARGTIIRAHTRGVTSHAKLVNLLGPARKEQMEEALEALISESLLSVPQRGRQRPQ